ncbi:MAG: COG1361 S-layer family protein [Candidatus Woesearchaeota archaeon]
MKLKNVSQKSLYDCVNNDTNSLRSKTMGYVMSALFLISFIFLVGITVQVAEASTQKHIQVSLVNQEPDPVEPGQYIRVRFKFENLGTESTQPITVGLVPAYPFSLVRESDREKNIGSLLRRQVGVEGQIVEWRLKIDKDAPDGPTPIDIYYSEQTAVQSRVIFEDRFFVNVRGSDTILEVEDIRTQPDRLVPGQQGELTLSLRNVGASFIKDVAVGLDLAELDFATVGSTSERIISRIDGGEVVDVTFTVIPSSSMALGAYQIPLHLRFKDNINNNYEHHATFGVLLESPVEYILVVDSQDVFMKGQTGDVTLRISNPGLNNIKLMTMELAESRYYDILSSSQIYVGRVDSDDFESITYKLHVHDASDDLRVPLRLVLNYMDDYNVMHSVDEEVMLRLYTEDEARLYGFISPGGIGGTLILLIMLAGIGGFVWYRRYKRKKRFAEKNR